MCKILKAWLEVNRLSFGKSSLYQRFLSKKSYARNVAPERAATEDSVMLPRTSPGASKNLQNPPAKFQTIS
jgi:hypothetical protein